jgi:hypothetical protein
MIVPEVVQAFRPMIAGSAVLCCANQALLW